MRKLIARFYGSTEGLVITIGLYIAVAYAIWASHEAAFANPVFGTVFSVFSLFFGATGFFLWADALDRALNAVSLSVSAAMANAIPGDRND